VCEREREREWQFIHSSIHPSSNVPPTKCYEYSFSSRNNPPPHVPHFFPTSCISFFVQQLFIFFLVWGYMIFLNLLLTTLCEKNPILLSTHNNEKQIWWWWYYMYIHIIRCRKRSEPFDTNIQGILVDGNLFFEKTAAKYIHSYRQANTNRTFLSTVSCNCILAVCGRGWKLRRGGKRSIGRGPMKPVPTLVERTESAQ
jgi:hypothetical protein